MYIFLTCQSEKYTIGERFIIVLKTKQMFLIIFYAKFKMALWRVLGIDKCGSLRAPQPSIRHAKDNTENQTESAAARSRPR